MKILCVANCMTTSATISGGDIRFAEIAKIWRKQDHDIHVLTTKAGMVGFKKLDLDADYHCIDVPARSNLSAYGYHLLKSTLCLPQSLEDFQADIIYSSCEQIRDVIPAVKMKRQANSTTKLGVVVHWLPPFPPWRRKASKLIPSTFFYINERLGLELARKHADALLPVSESTRNQLLEIGIKKEKLHTVNCGIHFDKIQGISSAVPKEYDAVFMKRLQAVKGVFDLIEIWKKVNQAKKNARLLVIGGGLDEDEVKARIKNEKMEKNVIFAGVIYDMKEKFLKLAEGRLFVLPSYEENWAIVIGEAMAAGLPVISYDLKELKAVWRDNYVGVRLGDKDQFAEEVIRLLESPKLRDEIAERAKRYVKRFDWEDIANEELAVLRSS